MLKSQPFAAPFAAINTNRAVHITYIQPSLNQHVTVFTAVVLFAPHSMDCKPWLQARADVNACASCCMVQKQVHRQHGKARAKDNLSRAAIVQDSSCLPCEEEA